MRFTGNGITNCYPDEVDNFISITVLKVGRERGVAAETQIPGAATVDIANEPVRKVPRWGERTEARPAGVRETARIDETVRVGFEREDRRRLMIRNLASMVVRTASRPRSATVRMVAVPTVIEPIGLDRRVLLLVISRHHGEAGEQTRAGRLAARATKTTP